jgi:hypothetical protein
MANWFEDNSFEAEPQGDVIKHLQEEHGWDEVDDIESPHATRLHNQEHDLIHTLTDPDAKKEFYKKFQDSAIRNDSMRMKNKLQHIFNEPESHEIKKSSKQWIRNWYDS